LHLLVAVLPNIARKLDRVEQDVAELKRDMKVVKVAVTATNQELKQHTSLTAHMAHGHA
jgi:hypothetical protein